MDASTTGTADADAGLALFVLDGSRPFGERVCAHLGMAPAPHEEREFEDGEHKTRPLDNMRGRDVFVLHSLYGEPGASANDKLCRLLFFIGALHDAGAARITAVVPYLAYARKDRRTQPYDPVTTRYVAALFEALGTNAVMTLDVHNLAAFENAFRCRTEHLEATGMFVRHLAPLLANSEPVVVSPDTGGIKRAEAFRQRLAAALGRPVGTAFAEKYRSQGGVSGEMLVGDVAGKTAIIIDDMISTGGTIGRAARACRRHGALDVTALASHGLFIEGAQQALGGEELSRVVVTDSVPPFRMQSGTLRDKLTMLDSSYLFAAAIRRLHEGGSIAELLAADEPT